MSHPVNESHQEWNFFMILELAFAIACGEKILCHMEPGGRDWHYRTKVDGFEMKCWYDGPRMKPRNELYWAESPSSPPPMDIKEPMRPPWEHDDRFKGDTQ